jgi:hypothetical protein
MNHQLTLEDTEKYINLLAKQFNELARSQIMSNKKTWAMFLAQEESDIIPRENLPVIESIFLGNPIIPIEAFRDIATNVLREYKYCTIIPVLFKMANGNLLPELVNHSLKMTVCVLGPEDLKAQPNPSV